MAKHRWVRNWGRKAKLVARGGTPRLNLYKHRCHEGTIAAGWHGGHQGALVKRVRVEGGKGYLLGGK